MEITKKGKMLAAILAICFIAYNVILFVICGFSGHTAVFWISWVFMLIAFSSIAVSGGLLGKRGMLLRDWLFGYPIIKHSFIYIIAETLASTAFIIFEEDIPFGWAFAAQFLFLCVYAVFAVSGFLAKETIDEVRTNVADKTRFLKLLRVDAEMLVNKCDDPELKGKLQKLSEDIRFSDPMSSETIFELEREITNVVYQCGVELENGNINNAAELCDKASLLLEERNRKCKALK